MSEPVPVELREVVQRRARGRCEYCLLHEEDARLPHEPDHILACKHRGQTRAENLAWACFACNRFKGSDIASVDLETGQIVRLFDPRRDNWDSHFRLEYGRILPHTPEGRVTEYLLQLNRPERVLARLALSAAGRYPR